MRLSFAGLTVTCTITGFMLAFIDKEVDGNDDGGEGSKRSRKVLLRGI